MPHWQDHAREHLSHGDVAAAILILTEALINLEQRMAANQADLDTKLTELANDVTTVTTNVTTAFNALLAKVQGQPGAPDLTAEVAQVQGAIDGLTTFGNNIAALAAPAPAAPADPAAPPTT